MKWSWKLGRFAGIDVRVHATFLILLAWIAVVGYRALGTASGALGEVLFVLALFASVVLHEYGHALTARRYGVGTREITLLPIGGVAQLERIPTDPRQELAIAAAGPAVTVVLVILLWIILTAIGGRRDAGAVLQVHGAFLTRLLWANIILAVFNIIPAFPMDGGRILRAALAMRMDYARATRIAAQIGKLFALVFGVVGLFSNPWLVLIALFVWVGAAGESAAVQTRSTFDGVPVERVMVRAVKTLAPGDPLSRAVSEVLAGFQDDFPVVENTQVVGVLTRADLMRALARDGAASRVSDAMQRDFQVAHPDEDLDQAFARLQACRCHTFPVVRNGRLEGVLTAEHIGEYLMVQSALARQAAAQAAG